MSLFNGPVERKQTAAIDRHVEEPDWEVDPDVPYHLVDDYLDTGGNMATARNWIVARGGTVNGYTIRSFISTGEAVIDLSDFTCAEGTGLLIREHSGELVRVPYLPPRVNLMTRASIPPSCWERFADAVLEVLTSPE